MKKSSSLRKATRRILTGSIAAACAATFLASYSAEATTYTWTKNTVATQTWTTIGNWAGSTQFVSGSGNELVFFSDITTALVNGTNAITGSVPATLSMNTLTLNGKGAAATAASTITIGTNASTWTIGDGTTSTVNLNGVNGTQALNYTVAANLTLNQTNTLFTGNGTAGFTFSGVISGTSKGITKSGSSTLTLTNAASTYTGATIISGGILDATTFAAINTASSIGKGSAGGSAADLVLNGGTLKHSAANVGTTDRLFSVGTSGGTIDSSNATAANSLSFTGTGSIGFNGQLGTRTLTLGGTNTGTNTMAALIANDGSNNATSLTKTGTGVWILTNANTYTGQTLITAGELRISSAGALNGTSDILVTNPTNSATVGSRLYLAGGITIGSGKTITINGVGNFLGALGNSSGNNEWAGNVTIGSAGTRIGSAAGDLKISGVIDSGGNNYGILFRTGNVATVTLTGANTYVGDTTIAVNATATSSVILSGGANRLPTTTKLIIGVTTVSGILDLNGQNQEVAGISVTQTSGTFSNEVKSATAATFKVNTASGSPSSYPGLITGGIILEKAGLDALTLSGANTYTGNTTISGGTLSVSADTNLGTAPGSPTVGSLVINGGTLSASTGFTLSFNRGIALGSSSPSTGGTMDVAASQTLIYGGIVANNGGTNSLTKTGAGTLTLSGTNTYGGATNVNAGTLTISGTGAINSTSGITVSGSGAKFLQTSSTVGSPTVTLTQGTLTGSGTVGAVGVADTTTAIISNNDGVAGASLTTGALTFNGAATVNTFSSSTAAPLVASALSTNAAGIVTINPSAVAWTTGSTYDLIKYSNVPGSIGGAGFAQFSLGTVTGLVGRQTIVGPGLGLGDSFTAVTFTIGGYDTIWTGATATSEWSTAILANPKNWTLSAGGGITDFQAADGVFFNDSGTIKTVDISNGNVSPNAVTFNNSSGGANDYTVTGSNGISAGALTKTGTGTLTINNANTYTGATSITGGTVSLAGSLDSTAITVGASGTLAETTAGVIGGSASLTTSGTTTLAGINTYSGTTTLNAGTLRATTSASALGGGTLTLAGGELQLADDAGLNFARNTTVSGNSQITSDTVTAVAGVTQTLGTLSIGANTLTIAKGSNVASGTAGVTFGTTTLTGNAVFDTGSDTKLTLGGLGGNFNLTKQGAGTLTLPGTATNTSGITTINGGTLQVSGGSAIANTGLVTLGNVAGATFQIVGSETVGALSGGGATGGTVSINASQTLSLSSGTQTYAGTISGAGVLTNSGATQTINGAISNSGGVNVTSGVLTLGGSTNSYTGATTVSVGAWLVVTADNALGAVGSGNGTTVTAGAGAAGGALGFSGGVNYSATEKITGSGTGGTGTNAVFAVSQRGFVQGVGIGNSTFAGAIEISATGISRIGTQTGAQLTLSGPITLASGVTGVTLFFRAGDTDGDFVTLSGSGSSWDTATNIFTGNAGTGSGVRLGVDNGLSTAAPIVGFTGSLSGTTLDLAKYDQEVKGLSLAGATTNLKITNSDSSDTSILTLNLDTVDRSFGATGVGVILDGVGVIQVIKNGAFKQSLFGINTYTGGTRIDAGTLSLGHATNTLADGGAVNVNGGILALGTNTDTVGAVTLTSGNITGSGAGTLTGTSYDVRSGSVTAKLGGSVIALTKTTGGTVTLSGANTYTGTTTISAGTLEVTGSAAIADAGAVSIASVAGAALLVSASETIGSLAGGTGATGAVTLGANTLTVGDASTTTFGGTITGTLTTGTLVKQGAGVLDLATTAVLGFDTLTATGGTTNVNSALGTGSGTGVVAVTGATTKLRFGSVSQTLSSLTIGAGSTVVFTSGTASGPFSGGGSKSAALGGGSAVVPEAGTLGLLLVGTLGLLGRRRRVTI